MKQPILKFILKLTLLFGLMTFSFLSAAEDGGGAIRFTNTVKKQIVEKNVIGVDVIRYVEPTLNLPGDTMMYTITFENIIDQPVGGIVVNDPLPNNSKYLEASATGDNTDITFSIDGKNFDVPEKLTFRDASGITKKVPAEKYTHIRWVYKKQLEPGETGTVTFKTKIRKKQE